MKYKITIIPMGYLGIQNEGFSKRLEEISCLLFRSNNSMILISILIEILYSSMNWLLPMRNRFTLIEFILHSYSIRNSFLFQKYREKILATIEQFRNEWTNERTNFKKKKTKKFSIITIGIDSFIWLDRFQNNSNGSLFSLHPYPSTKLTVNVCFISLRLCLSLRMGVCACVCVCMCRSKLI